MESYPNEGDMDERLMKQITLIEFISVLVVLIMLFGLGYCVYWITDMKYQALVTNKLTENEKWRNDLTGFLNYNVQIGRLVVPTATPPKQGEPKK